MTELNDLDRFLINNLQEGFPVEREPFTVLENRWERPAERILTGLQSLERRGFLSRFGAVINTRAFGGDSRLAAMSVPDDRLPEVINTVNQSRLVTHNYQRDHQLNLWFVLSATSGEIIDRGLHRLEEQTGLTVYDLPCEQEYYVGLKFRFHEDGSVSTVNRPPNRGRPPDKESEETRTFHRDLVRHIQNGLPLMSRLYDMLATNLGLDVDAVLWGIRDMLDKGKIKRIGCIPNHYALGIKGNGMTVFDVPDDEVDNVGRRLGERPEVTHCYRRPRHQEIWPYNLFAMVHERTKEEARTTIDRLRRNLHLEDYPYEILFSRRLLKKTGLRLSEATE